MTEPTEPTGPSEAGSPPPVAGTPTQEERVLALVAHLGGLPTGFIAPLIIFLVKGNDSGFVSQQAKEALNFQITMMLAFIVGSLLFFVAIGCIILPILGIADLVLCLIAALKAYEGQAFRYPLTLRLVN